MAVISAIVIRVILAQQSCVTLPQRLAINVTAKAQHIKRASFLRRETRIFGFQFSIAPINVNARAGADGLQRIGEISPARYSADPGVGAERATLRFPTMKGRLGAKDFLGVHAFEIIVARIELAHVVQAKPTVLARPVETGRPNPRRAELARAFASGPVARLPAHFVPAMKSLVSHWLQDGG